MKQTRTDMLNGPVYKQILLFFFPIMLGTFFQQLYNTVDAIVVGNFIGKEALAAVGGSTGILINLLVNFVTGLAGGSTVVIAQAYGASNEKEVKDGVRSGMFLGLVLGSVLMVIGLIFAPNLLRMLNVPDEILGYSVTYMRIYLSGMIPVMIYNVGASILRAVGDSKRPLYFLIVSCLTNIVLDVILVAVFKMGIAGAAIATVVSQIASSILVLYVLGKKNVVYHFSFNELGFDASILKRIVIIGLPMGIQSVLYSVSNLFIQSKINLYGTNTMAAFTAFGKIDSLYWMISGAYGQATVTMVGQCFGAKKIDRLKKAIYTAIILQLITTAIIATGCILSGKYLYRMFTSDVDVINIGISMLNFLAPYWATFTLIEIFSSAIRACGESIKPMLLTAFGICGFRIIWLMFYPCSNILETLACYPISWVITSIMFVIYFYKGKWLKRALANRNIDEGVC